MLTPSGTRFDYVTLGHVTCDEIEHGTGGWSLRPGGSAFYSALQAARLGLRTLILTQGVPGEIEALLEPYLGELELYVIPAEHTTRLGTRGTGTERTQRMLAWAGPIVEPVELDTAILHLAPVARETPVRFRGRADFLGVTPQGLIRYWERQGEEVSLRELDLTLLPSSFDAAVISEHERDSCHPLFSAARRNSAPVAVTDGSGPTTVYLQTSANESIEQVQPPFVAMRDDIGAGDVFAAAFFFALADGRTSIQAARLGNAAAAIRIAGSGPGAIGRPATITP